MSAFFDRFEELCRARGETPNSVAKKLGIPSGSITAWKKGTEPRSKTIWKLVDFFGVDFNYMLGRTNEPTSFRLENGKFIIARPKNSLDLSEEEMLAREKHEIEEIQKALNTYTKKAPTDGEREVTEHEIKAAFFRGADMTDKEIDESWDDVMKLRDIVIRNRKRDKGEK